MVQLETLVLLNHLLLQEHPDLQEVQVLLVQLVLQDKVSLHNQVEQVVLVVQQVQQAQQEQQVHLNYQHQVEHLDLQDQQVLPVLLV